MKVQNVNNQQTFGALKLPEYSELSTSARAVVREVDAMFKPQGIVYETMFFRTADEQGKAAKRLLESDDIRSIVITPHVDILS